MEKKADYTLSGPGVVDKYKDAGVIARNVLNEVIEKCQAGADIKSICSFGNQRIKEEVAKIYNNKKINKGVAFPVCISPGKICGHFSPYEDDSEKLQDGQLVKIDLGVHVDEFPVLLAHTIVIGEASDEQKALLAAGYNALVNAIKILKPKTNSHKVTSNVEKIIKSFGVSPMRGVLSHSMEKNVIDGVNVISNVTEADDRVNNFDIEANTVFAIDIVVSANKEQGKNKYSELNTTVFKRNADTHSDLKTKSSRALINEI